jgi:hypothetical protein
VPALGWQKRDLPARSDITQSDVGIASECLAQVDQPAKLAYWPPVLLNAVVDVLGS